MKHVERNEPLHSGQPKFQLLLLVTPIKSWLEFKNEILKDVHDSTLSVHPLCSDWRRKTSCRHAGFILRVLCLVKTFSLLHLVEPFPSVLGSPLPPCGLKDDGDTAGGTGVTDVCACVSSSSSCQVTPTLQVFQPVTLFQIERAETGHVTAAAGFSPNVHICTSTLVRTLVYQPPSLSYC